jgi:formate-dependent nitrite reductase membrane component NrfD
MLMNLFVADPGWGWWIILYFFFGGIAAGAHFSSTLIDLFGHEADRNLARIGYRIALVVICLCGLFLTVDLGRPERFWHMLFKSEVVHQALEQGWPQSGRSWSVMGRAVIFKPWSPMSVGAWALLVFGMCSFLSCLGSLYPTGRLAHLLRFSILGRCLQVVGSLVGFFVASYTGALLTATNQPVWSDSVWIAPLFLTSASSTGLAAILIVAQRNRSISPEALSRLERADLWALALELVLLAIFLLSLGTLLRPLLHIYPIGPFIFGTLFLGILAPFVIHLRSLGARPQHAVTAAVLALVGGFMLRYAVVTAAPAILVRSSIFAGTHPWERLAEGGTTLVNGISPEDGRKPGGGPGADPGNRGTKLEPRSKVFDEPATDAGK